MSAPIPSPLRKRPSVAPPRLAVTPSRHAAAASPTAAADPGAAPATILLVEDDPAVRALFSSFLRHAGYEVIEAFDGADALSLLDGGAPAVDLLITDVVMPNTGGPALVATIRTRRPGLRVLYVSGYPVDTEPADDATPDTSHVQKPLTRSVLLAQVATLLDGRDPVPGVPPA